MKNVCKAKVRNRIDATTRLLHRHALGGVAPSAAGAVVYATPVENPDNLEG
jgi:hypothetical protein